MRAIAFFTIANDFLFLVSLEYCYHGFLKKTVSFTWQGAFLRLGEASQITNKGLTWCSSIADPVCLSLSRGTVDCPGGTEALYKLLISTQASSSWFLQNHCIRFSALVNWEIFSEPKILTQDLPVSPLLCSFHLFTNIHGYFIFFWTCWVIVAATVHTAKTKLWMFSEAWIPSVLKRHEAI